MKIVPTFLEKNHGHDIIQLPIFMHIVTYSNSCEFVMMIMILIRNKFIHLIMIHGISTNFNSSH